MARRGSGARDAWLQALFVLAPGIDVALLRVVAGLLAGGPGGVALMLVNDALIEVVAEQRIIGAADFSERARELHAICAVLISEAGRSSFGPHYGVRADIFLHELLGGASPRPLDARRAEVARYLADPAAYRIRRAGESGQDPEARP